MLAAKSSRRYVFEDDDLVPIANIAKLFQNIYFLNYYIELIELLRSFEFLNF